MDEILLAFFKALADPNRLRMVGLLGQRPYTVEELAELLDLRASTTSHHLARLSEAGLVSSRADGHYHEYSLDTGALEGMARKLLATEELSRNATADVDVDAYDRKVLAAFTGPDGRMTAVPMKRKKFEVLLRHVLQGFEPGVVYNERQINDKLKEFADDVASLRRGLVDTGLMQREPSGARYWRT